MTDFVSLTQSTYYARYIDDPNELNRRRQAFYVVKQVLHHCTMLCWRYVALVVVLWRPRRRRRRRL